MCFTPAHHAKHRGSLVLSHQQVSIPDSARLRQVQLARLLGRSWCLSLGLRLGCCCWLHLGLQLDGHVRLASARLITWNDKSPAVESSGRYAQQQWQLCSAAVAAMLSSSGRYAQQQNCLCQGNRPE